MLGVRNALDVSGKVWHSDAQSLLDHQSRGVSGWAPPQKGGCLGPPRDHPGKKVGVWDHPHLPAKRWESGTTPGPRYPMLSNRPVSFIMIGQVEPINLVSSMPGMAHPIGLAQPLERSLTTTNRAG
jgi:hypothetical protein